MNKLLSLIYSTRVTAVLFLVQRGLGTGLTIYAPSIILSAVLVFLVVRMRLVRMAMLATWLMLPD